MFRLVHRWPGLLSAVLILALSLSGAALSLFPAMERLSAPTPVAGQTVGDLAVLVMTVHPGVEQIRRSPSGKIRAYWFEGDVAGAAGGHPADGSAGEESARAEGVDALEAGEGDGEGLGLGDGVRGQGAVGLGKQGKRGERGGDERRGCGAGEHVRISCFSVRKCRSAQRRTGGRMNVLGGGGGSNRMMPDDGGEEACGNRRVFGRGIETR